MKLKYALYKHYRNLSGIYLIQINEKKYVGSSVNLYKRIRVHLTTLNKNCHENQHLQRLYNKYGETSLLISVLEFCTNIDYKDLLEREKYYIELLKADINMKMDPVTQNNCKTISKKVYQYSKKGVFLKEWVSISEAARFYKIHSSNIIVCIKNPKRQRFAAGYLWNDVKKCPQTYLIYAYDLSGKLSGIYTDTIDIFNKLWPNENRKSVLSIVKSYIDTGKCYKDVRFFTSVQENCAPKKTSYTKRKVYQYTKEGDLVKVWESINDIPYSRRSIRDCIRGQTKTHKGFCWTM